MTKRQQIAQARRESQARIEAAHAATREVVRRGVCPDCGSALQRNNSLAGWWQCEQYGSDQFRARPDEPSCSWQGFTE